MGFPIYRNGMLLHNLQQRRLRFRRGTVDFIRQQKLTIRRPLPIFKFICFAVKRRKACNIGRQGIRCELNTLAAQTQCVGKRNRQCCFADTGAVLQ